jgi:hypothetical protein
MKVSSAVALVSRRLAPLVGSGTPLELYPITVVCSGLIL